MFKIKFRFVQISLYDKKLEIQINTDFYLWAFSVSSSYSVYLYFTIF